jgi:hypothetical protein
VLAALVFVCAPCGRAVFHLYFRHGIWGATVKWLLLLCSVAPVFVGVNLTDLRHARLAFMASSTVPTDTGVAPTGAYLAHMLHIHQVSGLVDQNQAIWEQAKATRYEAGPNGIVTYLMTPMEAYLRLAIHLQDKEPRPFVVGSAPLPSSFYVDSRSLMRFRFVWPFGVPAESVFATAALVPATATHWHGVTILRNDPKMSAADSLSAPLWAFNEAFAGDEFRLESLEDLKNIPASWAGKTLVVASRDDFTIESAQPVKSCAVSNAVLGRWQLRLISPLRAGQNMAVHGAPGQKIYVAISALPSWMSLKQF